ncbi:phage tail protein, partial [Paenibacillus lactis]
MPSQTPNLDLYKVNGETDGNDTFNVDVVLNDNWDKIDAAVGQIQEDLGNVTVPDASLTQKGIVQLSNATNGTRENVAATEKAVKDAYDRGSAGVTAAAAAQARADAAETPAGAQAKANAAETNAKNYVDGKTWQK